LYRGEWQLAADYAAEVLGSPLYSLASDYGFWGSVGPEFVFVILNSSIDNGRTGAGGWAEYYNPAGLGARGDAPFSADLVAAYQEEEGDRRFTELTQVVKDEDGNVVYTYTTKFPDVINNSDHAPVIRTTEVALNRAEALAQLNGVNQESLDIINTLRTRAGLEEMGMADFASKEAFIEAILDERRKELAFEGHRRMDLLRNMEALRPASDPNFAQSQPGQPKTILPIPQRERDINPALEQNTGY
ncbi:MAG: RagB/SusD family nutrient uptake outer membrane protein, partial [Bacteroidetes bacterium]|nr:RagB/SusD family nutrient uptake outer membrane protein [Bacteroidota bacterium]